MSEDSALRALVDELITEHPRVVLVKGQPVEGAELPLLAQLYAARSSDFGTPDDGPGGGGTPGNVIDPDAVALWATISAAIESGYRDARQGRVRVPEYGIGYELPNAIVKLRAWHRHVTEKGATMAAQVNLYAQCLTWIQDIRNHLEPEKRVPMRGLACGACGAKVHKDVDSKTRQPAILLIYTRPAPVAVCRACGESWTGGELLELGSGLPPAGVQT